MLLLAMLMASAPVPPTSAHPRWMVGYWCFPPGHPLRLRPTDESGDGDETIIYDARGRWRDLGTGGTWRIQGQTLIERRDYAEPGFLGTREPLNKIWRTRFVRHGRYAISMHGGRVGWSVKCPVQ